MIHVGALERGLIKIASAEIRGAEVRLGKVSETVAQEKRYPFETPFYGDEG